jgi:hypothetical protein
MEAIAKEVESIIMGLWMEIGQSRKKIEDLASTELMKLCREAGWNDVTIDVCKLGDYAVDRFSSDFRRLHTKRKIAKQYADEHLPRQRRDHTLLRPMEIVVGDVHPTANE